MTPPHDPDPLRALSLEDLESLAETLDIIRDDDLIESLRRSREEAAYGERLPLKDSS